MSSNDIKTLEAISDVKLNGNIGGIKNNLEEIENVKEEKTEKETYQILESKKNEKKTKRFDNGIGGFSENEYIIDVDKENIPPRVWSNVLANKEFGTVTTETGGGYTWLENSRLKRITSWENDPIQDFQSEVIIVKDLDKKIYWNLGSNPHKNSYQVRYGMGYSKYIQENENLIQENTVFIPISEKIIDSFIIFMASIDVSIAFCPVSLPTVTILLPWNPSSNPLYSFDKEIIRSASMML